MKTKNRDIPLTLIGLFNIAIASATLAGHALQVRWLTDWNGPQMMAINTAVCLGLTGLAFCIVARALRARPVKEEK
jgi:hypothetical protein